MLALAVGCSKAPTNGAPAADDGAPASKTEALAEGERITEKMLAAYREANTYTDHATYVQHSVYRGEGVERDLPFFHMSIAFARPNRLRLSFQEAVEGSAGSKGFDIASDGIIMRCSSGELAGQVQESAAPVEITTDNLLPDPLIREVFKNRQLGDVFPQLAMLLSKEGRPPVFPDDESPRLLDRKELRGRECYRVATTSPKGTRTFWIDVENYTLHRMELPIEAERDVLDAENQFSQLSVWIDFEDATFNAQVDPQSFEMDVPEGARRVKRFVAPPPPAPPEELGKLVAEFEFKTVAGEPVTLASLTGKTVLLDFWQVDCAPCKAHTPDLDTIYRELKSDENFAFYAVNIDGPRVDAETAENTLRGWGGSMPVLVDAKQDAFKKLKVEGTPTLMLLDGEGRLQYFHIRQHREPKRLAEVIRKVLGGADLAAEVRQEHRQLTEDYQAELDAATIEDAVLEVEVARPEIGERKLPEQFKAAELWQASSDDVKRPGNSQIVSVSQEGDSEQRMLVLDGGEAVVEFDVDGNVVARHELPADEKTATPAANGILRPFIDGEGNRWFAASGVGWQKVHVFDPTWKPILTFPKDRHPGIADVQLVPHGEKGEPRLVVGYWGGVGVQGVNLAGKRVWADRTLDQVIQITVVPRPDANDFELWCTSTRGTILVLDRMGKPLREIQVGIRSVMQLAVADVDGKLHRCGLTVEELGQYEIVGFAPDGQPQWHYKLPRGEYSHQVERIQHVMLPNGSPAWMVAAADGTVLWLDHDGQLVDRFQYGKALTGLSLTNAPDSGILLVSTPEQLTAWKLTSERGNDESPNDE
ncbi:MAG TPA: redoxin domain-containing protein [Lacipirellula sp.]